MGIGKVGLDILERTLSQYAINKETANLLGPLLEEGLKSVVSEILGDGVDKKAVDEIVDLTIKVHVDNNWSANRFSEGVCFILNDYNWRIASLATNFLTKISDMECEEITETKIERSYEYLKEYTFTPEMLSELTNFIYNFKEMLEIKDIRNEKEEVLKSLMDMKVIDIIGEDYSDDNIDKFIDNILRKEQF